MEIQTKITKSVIVPTEVETIEIETIVQDTAAELKRLEGVIEKQTIVLFKNLVRIQSTSRMAGLPFSHKYINFYKALRVNAKRTGITLPKTSEV